MAIRYDIETTTAADNELIHLWTHASRQRRDEITRASHAIEKILSEDADRKGIPRGSISQRIFVKKPLVVYFDVIKPKKTQARDTVKITAFREVEEN